MFRPSHNLIAAALYLLSIDSADVSFAAQARRVDRVLDSLRLVPLITYTQPPLDGIDRAVALASRLGAADEPEPLAAVIARVGVPVTVLLGGAAHTAGPVAGELSAPETLGPLLRVETMVGVGHFPHEEAPDEVARRLIEAPREAVAVASEGAA